MLGGRWLITLELLRQIVFYDIATQSRQVVWEDTGMITSWDACSVTSTLGFLVYIVFGKDAQDVRLTPWYAAFNFLFVRYRFTHHLLTRKLLEFQVHDGLGTGHISHSVSLDVPRGTWHTGHSVSLSSGKTPFLYITGHELVFDMQTRRFYEFPKSNPHLVSGR